jgi:enoyl-CoA hydratase/carnithine racemase
MSMQRPNSAQTANAEPTKPEESGRGRRGFGGKPDSGPKAKFNQLTPYLLEHKGALVVAVILSLIGAGASLALACDFIIASTESSLIEAFVNIGLVLDSGSSFFLPRLVGKQKAFEIATLGEKISASQAFEWGMVNRLVEPTELEAETDKIALRYAQSATKAIGLMKRMLNKSFNSSLEEMLEAEKYCQEIAGNSEDYREGVNSFNEKRKPEFKGR